MKTAILSCSFWFQKGTLCLTNCFTFCSSQAQDLAKHLREEDRVKVSMKRLVTFVGKFADWKRLDAVLYAAKEYEVRNLEGKHMKNYMLVSQICSKISSCSPTCSASQDIGLQSCRLPKCFISVSKWHRVDIQFSPDRRRFQILVQPLWAQGHQRPFRCTKVCPNLWDFSAPSSWAQRVAHLDRVCFKAKSMCHVSVWMFLFLSQLPFSLGKSGWGQDVLAELFSMSEVGMWLDRGVGDWLMPMPLGKQFKLKRKRACEHQLNLYCMSFILFLLLFHIWRFSSHQVPIV